MDKREKMTTEELSQDTETQGHSHKKYGQGKDHGITRSAARKTMAGAEEDLGDNIYPFNDSKAGDKFSRTTEAIVRYLEKKIEHVGAKVADTIRNMKKLDLARFEPSEPMTKDAKGAMVPKKMSRYEEMKLSQALKDFSTLTIRYEAGLEQAYGIILGQCTPGMLSQLEQRSDWGIILDHHDPIELLMAVKEVSHDTQDHEYEIKSFVRSLRYLVECKQDESEGISSYAKRFKNVADLIEAQCGGTPILMRTYAKKHNVTVEDVYQRVIAYMFVENAAEKKSRELLKALDNEYAGAPKGKGDEKFPTNLKEAVTRVATYKPMVVTTRPKQHHKGTMNTSDEG